jgi:membrane protein insertase Oxa1/YidC/SpoIIIJ
MKNWRVSQIRLNHKARVMLRCSAEKLSSNVRFSCAASALKLRAQASSNRTSQNTSCAASAWSSQYQLAAGLYSADCRRFKSSSSTGGQQSPPSSFISDSEPAPDAFPSAFPEDAQAVSTFVPDDLTFSQTAADAAVATASAVQPHVIGEFGHWPSDYVMQGVDLVHTMTGQPYWLSVIGTTIALRLILAPLFLETIRTQAKVKVAKPEIDALQTEMRAAATNAGTNEEKAERIQKVQADLHAVYAKHDIKPSRMITVSTPLHSHPSGSIHITDVCTGKALLLLFT